MKSYIKGQAKKGIKKAVKKRKANTEDFMNIEFDLKARGMTPAQREKLAKKMGFDKESAKAVRTKDARGKLPKATDPGIAKKKKKADPKKLKDMRAAAKRAKKATPKSGGKAKRKYNMDAKQFEPKKPQAAGMVKRESPLKGKKSKLAEAYDGLTAGDKRAERLKGKNSKYYSVFKDRGMTPMKSGGYMKKKMASGGYMKKKMGGGKVYKRKHSGKVIKNNMSGQDLVNACYD
jgi:hypothetical protein